MRSQHSIMADKPTRIMAELPIAPFPGAPLVGAGVELTELVWLPVEEDSWVIADDVVEVLEPDAVENLESPVVVESAAAVAVTVTVAAEALEVVVAAATRNPAEVVSLTPQRASASKVKSIFLALHSLCCRVMESKSQRLLAVIPDPVDE